MIAAEVLVTTFDDADNISEVSSQFEDTGRDARVARLAFGRKSDKHRIFWRMPDEHAPRWPPSSWVFDYIFFRQFFAKIVENGDDHSGRVHITVLRSSTMRLLDIVGLRASSPQDGLLGRNHSIDTRWYTWKDFISELGHEGQPIIGLNLAERIWMTLERSESSQLALVWSIFMLCVIIGNLTVLILASVPETCQSVVPYFLHGRDSKGLVNCGSVFQHFCMLVFTVEYVTKLCCCPFVRSALFNHDLLLKQAVMPFESKALTKPLSQTWVQRLNQYVFAPLNIVDLVAILPYWVSLLAGSMISSKATSALRVIRVTRVARIMKTGRYLTVLQVLGSVMVSSVKHIGIIYGIIFTIAFLGGILIHIIEGSQESEHFPDFPSTQKFVFAGMLSMHNWEIYDQKVETGLGQFVWFLIHLSRGMVVILPVGPIKKAFDTAAAEAKQTAEMQEEVVYELMRPAWSYWYGLDRSARCCVEVCELDGGQPSKEVSSSSFAPMPVLESRFVRGSVQVEFPDLRPWYQFWGREPVLGLHFEWDPSIDMLKASSPSMPQGRLVLKLLKAKYFPGAKNTRWRCTVSVPVDPYGRNATMATEWQAQHEQKAPSLDYFLDWHTRMAALDSKGRAQPSAAHLGPDDLYYKALGLTLSEYSMDTQAQSLRLLALERQLLEPRRQSKERPSPRSTQRHPRETVPLQRL